MFYISKRAAVVGGVLAAAALIGVGGITSAVAADTTTAAAAPAVTVTVTADPLPAETVTADPLPAETVTVTVTTTRTRTVTAAPEPAVTVTRRVAAESPGGGGSFTAGTWQVGSEIPAGTYVTTLADGEHCYYARLAGFSGDLDDVIANDNYEGPARGRVTVSPSDEGVEFSGDCVWSRA